MRRALLAVGAALLSAMAAGILLLPHPAPGAVGVTSKEAGAAFLGLIILVVAILGPDWRDWF